MRNTLTGWIGALLLLSAAMAGVAQGATITGVSPRGEVAQVRQITVRFNEAVVPFGDLRQPDPMAVACEGAVPTGRGRWANDRAWLYDFETPLQPGTRCTLKPRTGWKPLNGALTGTSEFSFGTGGPAVLNTQPYEGSTIEEDQHFLLQLNGAATAQSVAASA